MPSKESRTQPNGVEGSQETLKPPTFKVPNVQKSGELDVEECPEHPIITKSGLQEHANFEISTDGKLSIPEGPEQQRTESADDVPHFDPDKERGKPPLNFYPRGYSNLAAFLNSDVDFLMFRRFGYLQTRLLLDKQDCLGRLEEELVELDTDDALKNAAALGTRDDDTEERKKLMTRIEEAIISYERVFTASSNLNSHGRPSPAHLASFKNYIHNRRPLCEVEEERLLHTYDFTTLNRPTRKSAFRSFINYLLVAAPTNFVRQVFCSSDSFAIARDCRDVAGNIHEYSRGLEIYYDKSRVDAFSYTLAFLLSATVMSIMRFPWAAATKLIMDLGPLDPETNEAWEDLTSFLAVLGFVSVYCVVLKGGKVVMWGLLAVVIGWYVLTPVMGIKVKS